MSQFFLFIYVNQVDVETMNLIIILSVKSIEKIVHKFSHVPNTPSKFFISTHIF